MNHVASPFRTPSYLEVNNPSSVAARSHLRPQPGSQQCSWDVGERRVGLWLSFLSPQVVQLEELLAVRHSVFVVGSAGAGKSQVLRSLHKTYQIMKRRPIWTDLNPKAVTNDELFGIIHPATREWKDGKGGLALEESFCLPQSPLGRLGCTGVNCGGEHMGLVSLGWEKEVRRIKEEEIDLGLEGNHSLSVLSPQRLFHCRLREGTWRGQSRAGIGCSSVMLEPRSWSLTQPGRELKA